ncbi:50S ribosomal protein L32 [Chitinivibrio alkaliphilus]|uniref:Large ribosomal subunit protein bL32 n=1 Tax=Chitinivibrio alkaliphilus ACht1 TaxID=1313304 RepID=U7D8S8_9BACT|nr:50S ribosomal protein L32 [Chitinivibrio alkaliphilus]ERP38784.1 ribosomal protein L32 [Chitinivibrio alkaliphilus ACht1]
MAVPKRRTSRTRRDKRRSHDALNAVAPAKCKNCGEPKLSHRVCPNCGFYKGEEVVVIEE